MNKAKKGLGRGLDAFFGDSDNEPKKGNLEFIDIGLIEPSPGQPRKKFNDDSIASLAETVKIQGVLSPLLVVKKGARYEIIAGERRYRAAMLAGLKEIPCIIKNAHKDNLIISLVENVQREDLNPIDEAKAYEELIHKTGYSQEKIASLLGKSRVYITNLLRLLQLPSKIREMIISGDLSEGHGRCLVGLPEKDASALAERIIRRALSVRETEEALKRSREPPVKKSRTKKDIFIADIEKELSERLSRKVEIRSGKKYRGTLTAHFYDLDDLNGLIESIRKRFK